MIANFRFIFNIQFAILSHPLLIKIPYFPVKLYGLVVHSR